MVSVTIIVDEMPLFRDGIAATLKNVRTCKVVDETGSIADAARIAKARRADLAILGIPTSGDTASFVASVVEGRPGIHIVCLTPVGSEAEIPKLLRAGARGCVSRMALSQELVRCVEAVLSGASYVSPSLIANVLRQATVKAQPLRQERRASLTERETRILELVAEGQSNRDIADTLALSEKTVKRYMTFIMQKIRVRNRLQAALYISNGGVESEA